MISLANDGQATHVEELIKLSTYIKQRTIWPLSGGSNLWSAQRAVPLIRDPTPIFFSLRFWPNIRVRQRSGEGIVRRNGRPKGCFWRVRFFYCPVKVYPYTPENLRWAEKKRTLQKCPSGRQFLRRTPSPLLYLAHPKKVSISISLMGSLAKGSLRKVFFSEMLQKICRNFKQYCLLRQESAEIPQKLQKKCGNSAEMFLQ